MPFEADDETVQAHLASMKADQQTGLVQLPRITAQQRYYVAARVGCMNQAAVAREVGISLSSASQ